VKVPHINNTFFPSFSSSNDDGDDDGNDDDGDEMRYRRRGDV